MSFDISDLYRADTPAGAAGPWRKFPEYNFVGGHNDPIHIPVQGLIDAAERRLKEEGQSIAFYGLNSGPQGYLPLREFIAEKMAQRASMPVTTDEILVTSGSLQALDLVNDLLLEPGDTVIVEAATYGGVLSRFKRAGVNYVGVNWDADGIDMTHLEELLSGLKAAGDRVKYIYTIPTVQNPTGAVMTKARRLALIDMAKRFDTAIFEDDCYADLLWEGDRPPAIRALDQDGRVLYCGSFSKSIAPALRVGYLIADWPVMSRLLSLKTDAGTGALEQMVLADYAKAHFNSHVDALSAVLKSKAEAMCDALAENFGAAAEFQMPKGGIFIWITLPEEVDTSHLAVVAGKAGIALNPGAEWSADADDGRRRLRLCFGSADIEMIREGVAKLADICHQETGIPVRSGNVER